jgi:hypothetical protein
MTQGVDSRSRAIPRTTPQSTSVARKVVIPYGGGGSSFAIGSATGHTRGKGMRGVSAATGLRSSPVERRTGPGLQPVAVTQHVRSGTGCCLETRTPNRVRNARHRTGTATDRSIVAHARVTASVAELAPASRDAIPRCFNTLNLTGKIKAGSQAYEPRRIWLKVKSRDVVDVV